MTSTKKQDDRTSTMEMAIGKDPRSESLGTVYNINEKALIRRIDYRIVPLMFFCYLMQFLDKVMINYANVMGLTKDTHLKSNQFSWLATSFFLAFALAELPQGILLQKFPVPLVLGINVILWGITVACTAACNSFGSLLAVRIILGALEAVISPSLVLITSTWYRRSEASPRYGIWYCGLGGGQIIGGILSFAFQHVKSTRLDGWRIMFLIVGIVNMVVGVAVVAFVPARPQDTKFLNEAERSFVVARLVDNKDGMLDKRTETSQIWDAVLDSQVWLLCLITVFCSLPSGVITTFSATLISGFGYTGKQAALLNIPSGVISILSTMFSMIVVRRGFPRWLSIVALVIPVIIGGGLMSFLDKKNRGGLLTGIYLINSITANAMIAASFAIANIIGPQTFQVHDAPAYIPAKITILVVAALAAVAAVTLRILLGFRNKKRNLAGVAYEEHTDAIDSGDITDMQNKSFRYLY